MPDFVESNKKINISIGALINIIAATVIVSSVYWRFVVLERDYNELQDNIHDVNGRLDRKTDRAMKEIRVLEQRIYDLEKPHTDS